MLALHPDPAVGTRPVTYIPYTVTLPGADSLGRQVALADGRKVWFRCHYPTAGHRQCVRFVR